MRKEEMNKEAINKETNHNSVSPDTAAQNTGFCDGCKRGCPLSDPKCPKGMEKAGWAPEQIEKAKAERPERGGKGNRDGRDDRRERPERGEHGDHGNRDGRDGRRERPEHGEHGERGGRGGCKGRPECEERGELGEHDGHRECEYHGGREDRRDHAGHFDRNERGGHHRGHHREMDPEKFSAWEENASEEEKLLHALRRCGNYMKHGAERRSGQFRVLSILAAAGGSAVQSDLAQQLDVRRASISEILTKMEARGLIVRSKDENDKRQLTVSLTSEGEQVLEEDREYRREDPAKMFAVLSEEERQQLRGLLEKLLGSWQ